MEKTGVNKQSVFVRDGPFSRQKKKKKKKEYNLRADWSGLSTY